jgi:hypothetical protein
MYRIKIFEFFVEWGGKEKWKPKGKTNMGTECLKEHLQYWIRMEYRFETER